MSFHVVFLLGLLSMSLPALPRLPGPCQAPLKALVKYLCDKRQFWIYVSVSMLLPCSHPHQQHIYTVALKAADFGFLCCSYYSLFRPNRNCSINSTAMSGSFVCEFIWQWPGNCVGNVAWSPSPPIPAIPRCGLKLGQQIKVCIL